MTPTGVSRRRLLAVGVGAAGLGAAGLGAAGLAGAVGLTDAAAVSPSSATSPPVPPPGPVGSRTADPRVAVTSLEWAHSAARGRSVRLVVVAPPGVDRRTLPVCVGLHGLGSTATWWAEPDVRSTLGAAWAAGVPPFAVAAVDGGDNYWHAFRRGDDPLRMLLDELPGWLAARDLARRVGGTPALAVGISMGGAGALLYARERARRRQPVRAVAALAPGLFTDWRVASRRPYVDEADWAAHDPLRFYGELAGTPTGVWCGDHDSFVDAARRYMALARPEVASVTPGGHEGPYYDSVLPQVTRFLGEHVRGLTPPGLSVRDPSGR